MDPEDLLGRVAAWSSDRSEVVAVALVGSWARGTARPDSDIDLVLLVESPITLLSDSVWLEELAIRVERETTEDWGLVQSRRVWTEDELEVEFGVTSVEWARTDPVDPGTAEVVRDGLRIVYDPKGLLAGLRSAVRPKGE